MSHELWYSDGLRFECTRCGNCCSGESGSVRLDAHEIKALARHLDLREHEFLAMYTRTLDDGATSLRERPDHDCVFLGPERGCKVHAHRPRQCRTWPFWRSVVATPRHWEEAARGCPGIDQGPRHEAETIRVTSEDDGTSGHIAD